ncbi:MAG: hypothetical protein IKN49_06325 [Elusimicrobiaceae bacterium]|nr:hypothetical protein [Elusimicrobiaceae bacterium]
MRKIKRFKISTRQKEITRKILRLGLDLTAANLTNEIELSKFVLDLAQQLDPGTVYELNENVLWDLGTQTVAAQGIFSACAVTLGDKPIAYIADWAPEKQLIAQVVLFEFLRTATLFVLDLIKEQAEKEEYEAQEPQFIYVPKLGMAPEPKLFQEASRADLETSSKILPQLLSHISSDKINVAWQDGQLTPQATVVLIVPWQKKKRKGKK